MKRFLLLISLLVSATSIFSQTTLRADKVVADLGLYNPVNDTLTAPGRLGEQRYRTSNSTVYVCLSMTAGTKRWYPYAFGGATGTGWNITGNTGTTAGTNFIGTTDGQALVFKANSSEFMRGTTTGNVGIGTTSPGAKLTVVSTNIDSTINDPNGIWLKNTTLSISGMRQQWSPRLVIGGTGFKSIGSVSNTMDFAFDVRPVSAPNITGTLNIGSSINGVTYKRIFNMTDRGIITDSVYGTGTVAGTPVYSLTVDGLGKFITSGLGVSSVIKKGYEMPSLNAATGVLNSPRNERDGIFLSIHRVYTRRVPKITGTTLMTMGSSYAAWNFCQGTNPYTRLATFFGKNYYTAAVNGADVTTLVWSAMPFGTFGTDTTIIVDCTVQNAMFCTSGNPYSGVYYTNDHINDPVGGAPKTKRYIYEGWKAFLSAIYLNNNWFAASTLTHTGFRTEVASDSVGSKSGSAIKGVGTISFTKPFGETTLVIKSRGADSIRQRLGTMTVTVGGVTVATRYFNGANDANRAPGPVVIKVGLSYEDIILKGLPDSTATVNIVCTGTGTDSVWIDVIGYLKSPDKPTTNLYLNSAGYGELYNYWVISNVYTDTSNLMLQKAVEQFSEYPVFIQNRNAWYDSTLHNTTFFGSTPAPFHLTQSASDSIFTAYSENLIASNYNELKNARWTTSGTDANFIGNTTVTGKFAATTSVAVGSPNADAAYAGVFRQPSDAGSDLGLKITANNQTASMFIGYQKIRTGGGLILEPGSSGVAINSVTGLYVGGTSAPTDMVEIAGNLKLNTAGNKIKIATGVNASAGTATLSSGTVTISTTAVTSSSLIFVVYNTPSGTLASGLSAPSGSIVNATSFVINSLTTAGVVNTLDNSTVRWWIIN